MELVSPATRHGADTPSAAANLSAPLRAFALLAKHLGIAVQLDKLVHERGTGDARWTVEDLARAAKQMGLQARVRAASLDDLAALPLPVLAMCHDAENGEQRAVLLLRVELDVAQPRYLIQSGSGDRPEVWNAAEAAQYLAGPILLLNNNAQATGRDRRFDISWFIPALVKYRSPLRDVLVASFFLQLLGLASPIFFQLVIDKVLVNQAMATLTVLAIGFALTLLFETALSGLRNWLFAHTSNRVDAELSAQLFRHLTALPLSYFESRRVGDTIARVRELESIREFLTSNAVTVVIDLFFTILFFIVMYHYAPGLTLIVLFSLPCYAAISFAISGPLRRMLEEKFRRGAESQSFLVENVAAMVTVKSMAIEPQMRDRWEKLFAAHASVGFDAAKLANWGSHLIQLVSKLTMLAILYFGAIAVIDGALSVGGLIAFNMLAGRVAGPVLRLSQLWQDFQQARIAVDRLGDVINTPTESDRIAGQGSMPDIRGAITVDKVRFRYRPDGAEALRGLDLSISAGEMIGITGPSGSGKSTLTKLIQRLYVPEQGRILIDSMDLALADSGWLRRQIGVVQQETILFSRTVRENIALADPARPFEAVVAAARLAGAHDFILQMPLGYDSVIDERGGNLSGGQRQRIAIARALINDPPILIFDEATSALDAESEAVVQRNLAAIAAGRTMIIIAHRLSAIRMCNRIVTVEDGAVTEIGDHEELLRSGGRYAMLFAAQSGGVPSGQQV